MKHLCYCFFIAWLSALTAMAQETPWWEFHASYQFTAYQTGQMQDVVTSISQPAGLATASVGRHLNMNGWDLSVQENSTSWFGGIIDFSGGYASRNVTLSEAGGKNVSAKFSPALFMMGGGPQFTYRKNDRIQPFARVICAAAYSNLNPSKSVSDALASTASSVSTSDTRHYRRRGIGLSFEKLCLFPRCRGLHSYIGFWRGGKQLSSDGWNYTSALPLTSRSQKGVKIRLLFSAWLAECARVLMQMILSSRKL